MPFLSPFGFPTCCGRLVGEGASNAAIIPVVTEYVVHHSQADTQDMLRALFGVTSGVLLVLTGVGIVCADPLVRVFASGFGPQALILTAALTEITFVYLFCVGLLALATGVLHAQRHFSAPAFAPVLLNIAIIGCALGLSGVLAEPTFSLACGVVLGGVLRLAWQLPTLSRLGLLLGPRWRPRHPAVKRVGGLLIPVVFGAAVYQLGLVITTALASVLEAGSVSVLPCASRLLLLCRLRWDCWCWPFRSLPVSSLRGAFQAEQLLRTAGALQTLAVGLWPLAVSRLLVAFLYALGDTRTPVWTAGLALLAQVGLGLMGSSGAPGDATGLAQVLAQLSACVALGDYGLVGLGLASSLAMTLNMLLLALTVSRHLPRLPWSAWLSSWPGVSWPRPAWPARCGCWPAIFSGLTRGCRRWAGWLGCWRQSVLA